MPADHRDQATEILNFWFNECKPWQWFRRSDARDAQLRRRFGALTETAHSGGLKHWEGHSESALALVLLLDQFSRQIWRDEARAFNGDARAQQLSDMALKQRLASPRTTEGTASVLADAPAACGMPDPRGTRYPADGAMGGSGDG